MPKGIPLKPTELDRFLDVDFACLQKVLSDGRIDILFDTDNQAINTKARLWRLRNSLLYYKPNEPLSIAAKTFVFKRQANRLTIVRREDSAEVRAQLEALKGTFGSNAVADPEEREMTGVDVDAALNELQDIERGTKL